LEELTDFGCPIKSADQIWGDFSLVRVRSRAVITQFDHQLGLIDENIVGFNVRMKNIAAFQHFQRQKKLLTVGPDGLDVETDVATKFFQNFSQIHTGKRMKTSGNFYFFHFNL
jgi:6-pyruvoyl-tetrahydropterin synthase